MLHPESRQEACPEGGASNTLDQAMLEPMMRDWALYHCSLTMVHQELTECGFLVSVTPRLRAVGQLPSAGRRPSGLLPVHMLSSPARVRPDPA
jgi:hypothetical protein